MKRQHDLTSQGHCFAHTTHCAIKQNINMYVIEGRGYFQLECFEGNKYLLDEQKIGEVRITAP